MRTLRLHISCGQRKAEHAGNADPVALGDRKAAMAISKWHRSPATGIKPIVCRRDYRPEGGFKVSGSFLSA